MKIIKIMLSITLVLCLFSTGQVFAFFDKSTILPIDAYNSQKEVYGASLDSLPPPYNLSLSDDLILQWERISNVKDYHYSIHFYSEGSVDLHCSSSIRDWSEDGSIASYDFSDIIKEILIENNLVNKEITIKIQLTARGTTNNYGTEQTIYSRASDYSNQVFYCLNASIDTLPQPGNLLLSDDLTLQWDSIPNVKNYYYFIHFYSEGSVDLQSNSSIYDWSENGLIASFDFSERIEETMISQNLINEEVTIKIQLEARGKTIYDGKEYNIYSPYSDYSNEVKFRFICSHVLSFHDGVPSTCDSDGTAAYWSCDICGKLFSDASAINEIEEPVTIPSEGHKLSAHDLVPATCDSAGTVAYWSCDVCEKLFSDEKGENEIDTPVELPAIGHAWGQANYVWSPDNSTVTATCICINDNSHREVETVNVNAVITSPTANTKGSASYTSEAFSSEGFTVQRKTIIIPRLENMFVMYLPDHIRTIEDEAFSGTDCEAVIIPENCSSIGKHAFFNCENLVYVKVFDDTTIEADTFEGCDNVVIDRISK